MGNKPYFLCKYFPILIKSLSIIMRTEIKVNKLKDISIITSLKQIFKPKISKSRSISDNIEIIITRQIDSYKRTIIWIFYLPYFLFQNGVLIVRIKILIYLCTIREYYLFVCRIAIRNDNSLILSDCYNILTLMEHI